MKIKNMGMNVKENKGITLIALIITIIIMLILAGSVSILLLGKNGIIEKAKLAIEEYKQAELNELKEIDKLYASIQIAGNSQITLDSQQLDEYINQKVEEKLNSTSRVNTDLLWNGEISKGKITLGDSIYNYSYLVFKQSTSSSIAIVPVDKNGMTSIVGGTSYAGSTGNIVMNWGFYISSISEDGKELTLTRCGISSANNVWIEDSKIREIDGVL